MSDIITQSEEQTHIDDASQASSEDKVQQIIDLLTGSGKKDFEELEKRFNVFCPFEAIGMVSQEIRHAHFLCFLLDPNQPHPFGDLFIKCLLSEVIVEPNDVKSPINPIDLHFMSASKAVIFRERSNIDILIEIPAGSFDYLKKDLVIVIELKIGASESEHQLSKYHERIMEEYLTEKWEHCFIFLTPDGIDPSEKNKDIWAPVSLIKVIQNFDHTVDDMSFNGKAVDLYRDYSLMLRRKLVEDKELIKITKQIWANHKNALETLYEHKPDLMRDILAWVVANQDKLIDNVKGEKGLSLCLGPSSPKMVRFVIEDWKNLAGFCTDAWKVKLIFVIELGVWSNERDDLKVKFVLGPGDQAIREKIYNSFCKSGIDPSMSKSIPTNDYVPFMETTILTESTYNSAVENLTSAEEMGEAILKEVNSVLVENLPEYDKIIREALATD